MTDQYDASGAWPSIKDLGVNRLEDVPRCLLELRARVEALEAAQQDKLDRLIALDRDDQTPGAAMAELRAASAEARPAGLVERVRQIIGLDPVGDGKARAAIREVAAWLREGGDYSADAWADMLEREANQ